MDLQHRSNVRRKVVTDAPANIPSTVDIPSRVADGLRESTSHVESEPLRLLSPHGAKRKQNQTGNQSKTSHTTYLVCLISFKGFGLRASVFGGVSADE